MKLHKILIFSLLISVSIILCIKISYVIDPINPAENEQKVTMDNTFQKEQQSPNKNLKLPKSSSPLESKDAYAIVVGISDYPGSSADLSYCDDDALDVYNMLINDYNFKTENVLYLQDSSASKAAISNALDQMASQISSDDVFFFYYSGHGGFGTDVGPYSWVAETPHNYPNNYDRTWSVAHSGAVYMRVHFSRLECEYGYDFLLCGDSDVADLYYYELYSGNYGYNFWSAYIPVDRYYLRFISDYSYTYYGFRVDMYEAILDDGTHYLCSYDSLPDSPSNYYVDSLLDSKLDNMNCAEKYVVLDSCNSGGMIPEVQQVGRYIMTACEDDESSLESPSLEHGVFTNFFLESFDSATDTNMDGVISMEESYTYTSSNTISYSNGMGYTHHPQQYDGITGESVLFTAFGALSMTPIGNSLSYSFNMYGTGLIEELRIAAFNSSDIDSFIIHDLTETPASSTGFGYYASTLDLSGVSGITDYGIFARISGNEIIFLNQTYSNDTDLDAIDDITEMMFGMNISNSDSDLDGLDDYTEFYGLTDPLSNDTDTDGMDDYFEIFYNLNPVYDDSNDDEDGDGLTNLLEYQLGSYVNDTDTDNDLMPDYWEYIYNLDLFVNDTSLDPDLDGISNIYEYGNNTNPQDSDTDSDTIDDGDELLVYITNPTDNDTDGDGLTDDFEIFTYLTNATNEDTEGDGINDYYEYINGLDPFTDDSSLDYDNDGLNNLLEYQCGTCPNLVDSDGDFMDDYYEYNCQLDPLSDDANLDFDNDGLSNLLEFLLNSLANNPDSDGDLIPDGWEYENYLDPVVNDGFLDNDGDGLNNLGEYLSTTDPNQPDTDSDGLSDGAEVIQYFTDPLNPDSDGDGYIDGIEVAWGTNPLDSKNSLNTFFFNILGFALIGSSGYLITRTTLASKKREKKVLSIKPKSTFDKTKIFNSVKVERKEKPKPVRPVYKPRPYTPVYTQTRPIYSQQKSLAQLSPSEINELRNTILYRLPSPKSPFSQEGKLAMSIANLAMDDLKRGDMFNFSKRLVQSLMMGVPEPMNRTLKTMLLEVLDKLSPRTSRTPIPPSSITFPPKPYTKEAPQLSPEIKYCGYCGKQNKATNKFCANCGRVF
jgi:hypothetical protein